MRDFRQEGYEKVQKLKAEAVRARNMAGNIYILHVGNAEEQTLLINALEYYSAGITKEAADIKRALDCGDEYGNIKSQDEKDILKNCIALMQEVACGIQKYALASGADIFQPEKDEDGNYKDDADGTEWYNHWYSSRFQYSQIVRELFLRSTTHAGGTSVKAKCRELGVDPSAGVTIEFDPDMNEDNYYEC